MYVTKHRVIRPATEVLEETRYGNSASTCVDISPRTLDIQLDQLIHAHNELAATVAGLAGLISFAEKTHPGLRQDYADYVTITRRVKMQPTEPSMHADFMQGPPNNWKGIP